MQLRAFDDALKAYQELLEVNPYDETVHNQIGWLHQDQRRYAEAEAAYRKQLELNPLDKFAQRTLGGLLVDMERYDEAAGQLQKAITLDPEVPELHVRLGTAYLYLGKNDEALAAFTKAVELAGNANTWNNIAYQLALKGVHLDRALQYAESAVAAVAAASRNFTVDHFSAREKGSSDRCRPTGTRSAGSSSRRAISPAPRRSSAPRGPSNRVARSAIISRRSMRSRAARTMRSGCMRWR